jgi:nicotinamide-nucleotide adenylyltransferase
MIHIDPYLVYGIWVGRFQPFHLGHVSFLERLSLAFDGPIVVAVIASFPSDQNKAVDAYSEAANLQHRASKNPLTVWERLMMINLYLESSGLGNRIMPIGIPRPDTNWDIVKGFYPPKRILCFSERNTFELQKVAHWKSLNERVKTFSFDGTDNISGTKFKEIIKNRGDWRSLLPPATVEYFSAIGGPERFAKSD